LRYPPRVNVLVTGATGFVGSAVAKRLIADGDAVHVLVRDRERAAGLEAEGARVFVGTIGDPNEVVLAARDCKLVVHAAGIASHRAAPRALQWTNVAGTENVINAARHVGAARVVHLSCADVTLCTDDRYGWNEDRVPHGALLDAHARSKRLAEDLALSASGIEVCALRPTFLWGAGDTTNLPAFCAEGLADNGIALYGDGRNVVATLHIDNLVDAVVAALAGGDVAGRAYYLSDSEFLDAAEIYGMFSKACGLPPPRTSSVPLSVSLALALAREQMRSLGPWRTDIVRRARSTQFDTSRALRDLEWKARVSVADGMNALGEWVASKGGAKNIAGSARPPADDTEVAAQIAAAGG
jgi:2-alkyl-3-oxoalkanoate reductase